MAAFILLLRRVIRYVLRGWNQIQHTVHSKDDGADGRSEPAWGRPEQLEILINVSAETKQRSLFQT